MPTVYKLLHLTTGAELFIEYEEKDFSYQLCDWNTTSLVEKSVQFWFGYENLLIDSENNYLQCFLTLIMREIIHCNPSRNALSIDEIIALFSNKEGFPPLDGSCGIKIVGYTIPDFSDHSSYILS